MRRINLLTLINKRPVVFVAEPIVRSIGIFITRLFAMCLDERACAVEFAVDGLDGDLCAVVLWNRYVSKLDDDEDGDGGA